MRLFNPAARPASSGRISADGRHISLTRPLRIDAETASRAQTPPGLSTVYFVQIAVASPRLTPSAVAEGLKELRETATLLIGGLAARLGGKAFPESARLGEPLHADVYSPQALTTGELSALLEPYAPGLAPAEGPWTADGVTTLHSERGQINVEYWPPSRRDQGAVPGPAHRHPPPAGTAAVPRRVVPVGHRRGQGPHHPRRRDRHLP